MGVVAMLSGVAMALLAVFVGVTLKDSGFFAPISPHNTEKCTRLLAPGLHGVEDLTLADGIAYMAIDNRTWAAGGKVDFSRTGPEAQGGIFVLDASAYPNAKPRKLEIRGWPKDEPDLHPHGLGVYSDKSGKATHLFFVAHGRKGEGVAVLKIVPGKEGSRLPEALQFETLVRSPVFVELNDVVPISPTSFYTTNFAGSPRNSTWQLVEMFGRRPWGFVVYCEQTGGSYACKKAATNLLAPNGINQSPDGRTIYVATSIGMNLLVFDREEDNSLTVREDIYVGTGLDNIEVDRQSGDLFIGCHPSLLHFLGHAADNRKPAPSQVLRIQPQPAMKKGLLGGRRWVTTELFMSNGTDLPASSVGAFLPSSPSSTSGRLFIGSVFADGVLVCNIDLDKDERPYPPQA